MKTTISPLLPNGFKDKLYKEVSIQKNIMDNILSTLRLFSYETVIPPFMEYDLEKEQAIIKNTKFKVIDPITNDMMFLRNDFTPQIARIASHRLTDQRRPLRLSYYGDVLLSDNSLLHPERQISQVGLEMIGYDNCYSKEAILEIISISVEAIKKIGINDITIAFNYSNFVNKYLAKSKHFRGFNKLFSSLLERKDIAAIKNIGGSEASLLAEFLNNSFGDIDFILNFVEKEKSFDFLILELKSLKTICSELGKRFKKLNIFIDLIEERGFEYYKGLCFVLLSSKYSKKELVKGGQYVVQQDNCFGASFYIDTLSKIPLIEKKSKKKIYILSNNFKKCKELQNKGYKVVLGFDSKNIQQNAKNMGCDFYFEKNIIKKTDR